MNTSLTCVKVELPARPILLGDTAEALEMEPKLPVEHLSIESLTIRANAITPLLKGILEAHRDSHWNRNK